MIIIQYNVLVGHLDAKEMYYTDVRVSHNFSGGSKMSLLGQSQVLVVA